MNWFTWTPLELAANVMTTICIVLAGRNNIHTWWTGIVGTVLFGILFYQSQLYADATLQIFFFVTGIIGWMTWIEVRRDKNFNPTIVTEIPITRAEPNHVLAMVGIAIIVAAGYGYLLHTFTNAYAPWVDSTVLTFSVVAQLLLMRRNTQTWPIWLLVNTLSVPLFWSRELYMTSVLYGFYWVNALVSWKHWVNLEKET